MNEKVREVLTNLASTFYANLAFAFLYSNNLELTAFASIPVALGATAAFFGLTAAQTISKDKTSKSKDELIQYLLAKAKMADEDVKEFYWRALQDASGKAQQQFDKRIGFLQEVVNFNNSTLGQIYDNQQQQAQQLEAIKQEVSQKLQQNPDLLSDITGYINNNSEVFLDALKDVTDEQTGILQNYISTELKRAIEELTLVIENNSSPSVTIAGDQANNKSAIIKDNEKVINIGELKGNLIINPPAPQSVDDKTKEHEQKPSTQFPLHPSLHNQTPPEENFVGQTDNLETITDWYKNEDVRIGALIGWGGVGKSALVRKWYDSLDSNNIEPDGIFWWGFYRNANLELFLNALLRFISAGQIEPDTIKSTWERVERIKEYIHQGSFLIILDGLEEMQKGRTSGEQFGCMEHRECSDMLRFLADTEGNGLCLITTRYPLTDINNYKGKVYRKEDIDRLSIEDARSLFEKVGVKGNPEEIDSVITEYGGHALSLTLLSGYLVEDFDGDITKAKDIPAFHSDEEAGGKAHRILLWYAEQLNEEQQAFMKIFSLFRKGIDEEDFEGVFRAQMETQINQPLIKMSVFSFKRLVDNLSDRRLISKDRDNTYSTHPLIKSYFESIFEQDNKKLCHKRIYQYFGEHAPQDPETLDQMQPLFDQVHHGCAAGLHDEVFDDVYWEKIYRKEEYFITAKLGAWGTALSVVQSFFPQGDLSKMPILNKRSDQSWLLNEAGLVLLSTGRPKEAEELLIKKTNMQIEDKDWINASTGYQNLADLQFRTSELNSALNNAQKALDMTEKAKSDINILKSKAYLGWVYHLLGKDEDAAREFSQADELSVKIGSFRLPSLAGVFYADFLLSTDRIDDALELTTQNLEFCQKYNLPNDFSRCYRNLCAIERTKGNLDEATDYLQKAFELARKVGTPELEIEVLLESAELNLATGKAGPARHDAEQVLTLCTRTGFKFYEPHAKQILAKTNP